MSNTATVPASVAIADMTFAQLSEQMSKLVERHDVLKASVAEYDTVKNDLAGTFAEIQKRLGTTTPVAAPAPVKAKAKKAKATKAPKTPKAPKAPKADGEKRTSLKQVVLGILAKNTDGLELKGIVKEVQAMMDRKEYNSNAESLSAVVSQAVNALKQEKLIDHDRDSKKYTKKAA